MNTPIPSTSMWYEQLPKDKAWSGLWSGYTICGRCHGIRAVSSACGVCGDPPYDAKPYLMRNERGKEFLVHPAVTGAEGRYEDWVYLQMIEREWKRPVLEAIPNRILDDMLRRYSAIGARLNDFYRVAFDSTYKSDLEAVGHGQVWPHLAKVQERRNQFAHGQPQAIDDALVKTVVENLKVEHEAWIAVFNKRAWTLVASAHHSRKIPSIIPTAPWQHPERVIIPFIT